MTFVSRRYYRPRSSRQFQKTSRYNSRLYPAWNALIVDAEVNTNDLTLRFDRPVILRSLPRPTGIGVATAGTPIAVEETAVVQTAPDTIVLTFDGSVAAADEVTLPNPPTNAIRTRNGGWTQSGVFPIPAG